MTGEKTRVSGFIISYFKWLSICQIAIFICAILHKFELPYANFVFDLLVGVLILGLFPILLIVLLRSNSQRRSRLILYTTSILTMVVYSFGLIVLRLGLVEKNWLILVLLVLVVQFYLGLARLIRDFDQWINRLILVSSILYFSIIAFL